VRYGEEDYPSVVGLVARYRRRDFFMSSKRLQSLHEGGAKMNSEKINLKPFTRRGNEVLLAKDVLDNQLIDVDGKRVVRVNDVQIIEVGDQWRVSGADVSLQGFLRRLMPKGFYGSSKIVEVIDWADVGYLATDTSSSAVKLKSSKDKLSRLHPVEIAQLAESLSPIHRTEIVESLDDEIAADTLEEMSTQELFDLMEDEEKADVAELMPFAHDTAGGLMTTEFIVFPKDLTVGQAIARLREMAETPNMIYYLYIVETEDSWKISGVISLRSLILADPTFMLEQVMRDQYQFAHPNDDAEEAAQKIAEYNLLALPVIDDLGEIAGIITVDDAMEILLPKNLGRRLPRLFG
jgi:magnesium transporter